MVAQDTPFSSSLPVPPVPVQSPTASPPNIEGTPIHLQTSQTSVLTDASSATLATPLEVAPNTPSTYHSSTSISSLPSISSPPTTSTAQSPPFAAQHNGLSFSAFLAVIIVPVLVVLTLIPIIYICYIHKRYNKRRESVIPEVRQQPREAALLHAHHQSHDSASMSTVPFTDSERAKEPSVEATWEPHQEAAWEPRQEETYRTPSPVLPSPSRPAFHAQEQWPLSGPLPEPPPPPPKHTDDDELTRPPSSNYGSRQAMLPRPPSEHEEVVSPQEQEYDHEAAVKNRQSDAVSELSFDSRSRRHRTKSMDGESFISAMDEEPAHDPMPARHIL